MQLATGRAFVTGITDEIKFVSSQPQALSTLACGKTSSMPVQNWPYQPVLVLMLKYSSVHHSFATPPAFSTQIGSPSRIQQRMIA